ncbi:MAG TPA: hypothetical protein VG265_13975 [Gaiellaceae bacterium]|nr:hypothetical protein [Gaiellaceae bacterium]
MAQPANRLADEPAGPPSPSREETPSLDAPSLDAPSLDPAAIERAYIKERARRRARIAHHEYARNSNARFWVMLAVLALLTVLIGLAAFHEIQANFGVLQ